MTEAQDMIELLWQISQNDTLIDLLQASRDTERVAGAIPTKPLPDERRVVQRLASNHEAHWSRLASPSPLLSRPFSYIFHLLDRVNGVAMSTSVAADDRLAEHSPTQPSNTHRVERAHIHTSQTYSLQKERTLKWKRWLSGRKIHKIV